MDVMYPDSTPLAIFDHDGVLVDTLEFHQEAWVELGRRCNLPITAKFIHETFGMTNPSIFRLLLGEEGFANADTQAYAQIKEDCYRDLARGKIALMGGVQTLLDRLTDAGIRLAIGSSGVLPNLNMTVDSCDLQGRFSAIASLEDIERGKPDPQVFLVAAAKARSRPERSVVFEDALVGIQAAKAAGMYAVGVTSSHPAELLWQAGADEVHDRLDEFDVKAFLGRINVESK